MRCIDFKLPSNPCSWSAADVLYVDAAGREISLYIAFAVVPQSPSAGMTEDDSGRTFGLFVMVGLSPRNLIHMDEKSATVPCAQLLGTRQASARNGRFPSS